MSKYGQASLDYVNSAKGIVSAANMLKIAIGGGDQGDIDFAVDALTNAASEYTGRASEQEQLGFDEIAQTLDVDLPKKERVAGDLLVSTLTDLEVANTLFVAGSTVGETTEPETLENLERAASQLDDLTRLLDPLGEDVRVPTERARFGFDEVVAPAEEVVSLDRGKAKSNY